MVARFAFAAAALLIVAAAPATSPTLPTTVIDLASYRFTPAAIHLRAGQPVTLRFTNSSAMIHDFTAKDFFARAQLLGGAVAKGKVKLDPGASASVSLVPARGTYKVRCTRLFHTMRGMVGSVVVD